MNIYEPPKSELEDQHRYPPKRSLWILIPVNLYFWWKLLDYFGLLYWSVQFEELKDLLLLSINIPVYFMGVCYIFHLRVPPRLFWKIWILIAIGDEMRVFIFMFNSWSDTLSSGVTLFPIYLIGLLYAYGSEGIWSWANKKDR